MSAALGVRAQYGMGATSSIDEAYSFLSETISMTKEKVNTMGMTGSRYNPKERIRDGTRRVDGQFTLNPTPVDLDRLLPRILGANEATDVFDLAETLPSFWISIDKHAKVFTWSGCVVSQAVFSASEGQPLSLAVTIMGIDETEANAATFPSISISSATVPYMFRELTLTIASTEYKAKSFTLTINNQLEEQVFNSATRTRINVTGLDIRLDVPLPYGDSTALHNIAGTGVAVSAAFANGGCSCTFAMPAVCFEPNTPQVTSTRGEIFNNLTGKAHKSGSTNELTVTNDSAP